MSNTIEVQRPAYDPGELAYEPEVVERDRLQDLIDPEGLCTTCAIDAMRVARDLRKASEIRPTYLTSGKIRERTASIGRTREPVTLRDEESGITRTTVRLSSTCLHFSVEQAA